MNNLARVLRICALLCNAEAVKAEALLLLERIVPILFAWRTGQTLHVFTCGRHYLAL